MAFTSSGLFPSASLGKQYLCSSLGDQSHFFAFSCLFLQVSGILVQWGDSAEVHSHISIGLRAKGPPLPDSLDSFLLNSHTALLPNCLNLSHPTLHTFLMSELDSSRFHITSPAKGIIYFFLTPTIPIFREKGTAISQQRKLYFKKLMSLSSTTSPKTEPLENSPEFIHLSSGPKSLSLLHKVPMEQEVTRKMVPLMR